MGYIECMGMYNCMGYILHACMHAILHACSMGLVPTHEAMQLILGGWAPL